MFSYPVNRPARPRTCCRTCELRAAAPAPRLRLQHRGCGSSCWKRMPCTAVNQRPATAAAGEGQRDPVTTGDGPRAQGRERPGARGSKRGSHSAAGEAAAAGARCAAAVTPCTHGARSSPHRSIKHRRNSRRCVGISARAAAAQISCHIGPA